jgi:hypothetical protein
MYATFARIVECKTLYAIYRIFTELFTKLYMHFTELHMKILFRHTLYKNPGSATAKRLKGQRGFLDRNCSRDEFRSTINHGDVQSMSKVILALRDAIRTFQGPSWLQGRGRSGRRDAAIAP